MICIQQEIKTLSHHSTAAWMKASILLLCCPEWSRLHSASASAVAEVFPPVASNWEYKAATTSCSNTELAKGWISAGMASSRTAAARRTKEGRQSDSCIRQSITTSILWSKEQPPAKVTDKVSTTGTRTGSSGDITASSQGGRLWFHTCRQNMWLQCCYILRKFNTFWRYVHFQATTLNAASMSPSQDNHVITTLVMFMAENWQTWMWQEKSIDVNHVSLANTLRNNFSILTA